MRYLCLCLTAAILEVPANAASPLMITPVIEKEVVKIDAQGQRLVSRIAAKQVVPGETVIYTYRLTNAGAAPASPVVLATPIPPQMTYIEKSAVIADATVQFSVDRGKSFADPGQLTIAASDGKRRPAVAADYTHIRWQLNSALASGASKQVGFRAILH